MAEKSLCEGKELFWSRELIEVLKGIWTREFLVFSEIKRFKDSVEVLSVLSVFTSHKVSLSVV